MLRTRGSLGTRTPLASLATLATLLLGFAPIAGAGEAVEATERAGHDPAIIRGTDLMQTIGWLASPELQGRLAGSPGFLEAAREMADRFRHAGLRPAFGDSFYQRLAIEYNDIDSCGLELISPDGSRRLLAPGADFACRGYTGSGDITAPVVFVGYGLSQPERRFDDYAGIDVRGRIVLAFKEAPPFKADSSGWGPSWMPRPKGVVAAAHGALALFVVSRPLQEHPQKPIGSVLEGDAEENTGFPRLQVSLTVAEEMVRAAGLTLAGLEARIDSSRTPCSRELKLSAHVRVDARYEAKRPSVNVVGILPGSDPRLRGEYVVLGAHLDHVGHQGHVYFPGANDNASGAATVLAIAEAFARSGRSPRRSLIFGLWSSEEAGCLGTRRFLEEPPVAKDSLVAYLNFDCVGHGDSIEVGGGKEYPRLWDFARRLDQGDQRLMVQTSGQGGGADADPFEEARVPNLYFASKFSYTYLHQPLDTPATLNPALLEAVARLGYGTAWQAADADAGRAF